MSGLDDAKKKYEEVQIPDELSVRVQREINRSGVKRHKHNLGKWAGAAAAAVAVFTLVLNTNTTFAAAAAQLPVIGPVARVLTFQSYVKEEKDHSISVEIPSVEMISEDTKNLTKELNKEIYELCSQYADDSLARAEEYKQAFMDTGGTQEEWEAHQIEIRVWYDIKSQTEDYLSLAVMGSENWTSSNSEARFYNLDLKKNTVVTMKEVLGENYIELADKSIRDQMQERSQRGEITFFTPEEGGFTGITENTRFYMNEAGNPVIVFDKYEIAPGAYGEIEFEIKR